MRELAEIKTRRLKLRPLRMGDSARVARFVGDSGVARMIASVPIPYFPVAAEAWIMTLAARAPLGRDLVFAVDLTGEGLIGIVGAHASEESRVEIGYWFGRPFWGAGFASEALRGFVGCASGPLHASHFIDNPASGRVLEKAGFAYTGETEQRFSLARGARTASRLMRRELANPPAHQILHHAWVG